MKIQETGFCFILFLSYDNLPRYGSGYIEENPALFLFSFKVLP